MKPASGTSADHTRTQSIYAIFEGSTKEIQKKFQIEEQAKTK
jgi:hypothetical protein